MERREWAKRLEIVIVNICEGQQKTIFVKSTGMIDEVTLRLEMV